MRHAYNMEWLKNLHQIKEAKSLFKSRWIEKSQLESIQTEFKSELYHPNFFIRILLLIVTLLGLSGVTGIFALFVVDAGETFIAIACILYGLLSLFALERLFIGDKKHYKSGVNEALIYHSGAFIAGGAIFLFELDELPALWVSLLVISIFAYRYLDLLLTLGAMLVFSYLLFSHLYSWGGLFQKIIPFAMLAVFGLIYWITTMLKKKSKWEDWNFNLIVIEAYSLLMIYLAGNYFVVRELSINMMQLEVAAGDDIPFAFVFYFLTIAIPIIYLVAGILKRDIVILRTSLLVFSLSVFTFKYYFIFVDIEIFITLSGGILLLLTIALFHYLRKPKSGFTRENLIAEKWGNMHAEAFVISQTLGGNQINVDESFQGQGGEFGGGGSTGSF